MKATLHRQNKIEFSEVVSLFKQQSQISEEKIDRFLSVFRDMFAIRLLEGLSYKFRNIEFFICKESLVKEKNKTIADSKYGVKINNTDYLFLRIKSEKGYFFIASETLLKMISIADKSGFTYPLNEEKYVN